MEVKLMCKVCDNLVPGNSVIILNGPMATNQNSVFGGSSVCIQESLKKTVYLTVESWLGDTTTVIADEEINYCPFCGKKFKE